MRQRADDRGGQEGDQDAEDEAAGAGVAWEIGEQLPQPAEIDAEDRQDRAELDQHLEGLAGRFEAEEMAGEQDVAGRRDRDELGQPLEQPEQQRRDDGLVLHGRSDCGLLVIVVICPYRSGANPDLPGGRGLPARNAKRQSRDGAFQGPQSAQNGSC